jgi:uncharacterized membrane protein (UPF0127 family)
MLASPGDSFRLETEKTGATIAVNVEPAFDAAARRRGLLRRDRLASGSAMVLAPCAAIHTAFMRFPIDVIFAGNDGTILKICPAVKPWRLAVALKAFAAIELAAGGAAAASVGDRLLLVRM